MNKFQVMNGRGAQNTLLGILETAVFVKSGPLRFGNSRADFALSFLPLLIILPVNLLTLWLIYKGTPEITTLSYDELAGRYVRSNLFGMIFILSLLYGFCHAFNRTSFFLRAACGMNWIALVPMIIFSIPLLLVAMGLHTINEVQTFGMVLNVYETVMMAFLLTHALPVRWFTGLFLAFMIYAIQYCLLVLVFIP